MSNQMTDVEAFELVKQRLTDEGPTAVLLGQLFVSFSRRIQANPEVWGKLAVASPHDICDMVESGELSLW